MRLLALVTISASLTILACTNSNDLADSQATIAAQQDVIDRQDARIAQLEATIQTGVILGQPAGAQPAAGAAPGPSRPREYEVQPGDSLSGIAEQFDISTGALAEANGIADANSIRAGQILTIPAE